MSTVQALRDSEELPDDWVTAARIVREAGRMVLGVSFGKTKDNKESWWWNEGKSTGTDRKRLCVFMDLEKAYDRMPRDELWFGMRKTRVNEKYMSIVQDLYENRLTAVGCAVETTKWFSLGEIAPGISSKPFPVCNDHGQNKSPWSILFADGRVTCGDTREEVETNPERWQHTT
ncbi:uncharacterized protein LOC122246434 [Penaeus japonicus]|uniref:uncharacterized protein LOC122246434 n=1 Tax=Penaeus japonicus TaxID=27405 RepID=UPI001C70BD81|nr:uncharacterized protein LOC122246434 [Penaeus japonicus]